MARPPKKKLNNLVFDLRVVCEEGDPKPWRLVAVSADSTLPELHRTIQGAFDSRYVTFQCLDIRGTRYEDGKGSRTTLRRVLSVGDHFACFDKLANRVYSAEVVGSYDVANRRHHPKVLDGFEMTDEEERRVGFDAKISTWHAQAARDGWLPVIDIRDEPDPRVRPHEPPSELLFELESTTAKHGFFCAVVSGPMLMPSEWVPHIARGRDHASLDSYQEALSTAMALYNSVASELLENPSGFQIPTDGSDPDRLGQEWCFGYLCGVSLRPDDWEPLFDVPKVGSMFYAIVGNDPNDRENSPLAQAAAATKSNPLDFLAMAATSIYAYRRRRWPS